MSTEKEKSEIDNVCGEESEEQHSIEMKKTLYGAIALLGIFREVMCLKDTLRFTTDEVDGLEYLGKKISEELSLLIIESQT
ncbi:MAG: hypothetical protein MRK02_05590 [Candidatus Scalindua sp.]|nr:hypothetical protein [Candidatus Scalindua sp.]